VRFQRTAIAVGAAQFVLMASGAMMAHSAFAQDTAKKDDSATATVVVVGQRAALESAAARKKNSDEIVDSIVGDDIGKLPDKSVTEVLQRVAGVSIDRTLNRIDPQQGVGDGVNHYAAEGTGVSIRGLSYVRSELNGRDSFSANGGRSLSFEDVPPELMAGVDVYKNPSAEQIEGGIGGLVNLRTHLPFDWKGSKVALSAEAQRSQLRGKTAPGFSGLVSNRWNTDFGQFGVLLDAARSRINTRSDGMQISPYYPRSNAVTGDTSGATRWISPGSYWTSNNFERERDGLYGALQWKKDSLSSYLTFFRSKYDMNTTEYGMNVTTDPFTSMLDPGAEFGSNGALLAGTLTNPGTTGVNLSSSSRAAGRKADTRDVTWHGEWRATDALTISSELQHVRATSSGYDNLVGMQGNLPKMTWDLRKSPAELKFDAADTAALQDPSTFYWGTTQEHRDNAIAAMNAARLDAKFTFDDPVLNDLRFGVRFTDRNADTRSTHGNEWTWIAQPWTVGPDGVSQLPYLSDPRFGHDYQTMPFPNFFGGKMSQPPSVIIAAPYLNNPSPNGPPPGFVTIHGYQTALCSKNPCGWAGVWTPATYGGPTGTNSQQERTQAAYTQLRFNLDKWRYPIDGNVGLRVVRTDMSAQGYLLYDAKDSVFPESQVPKIPSYAGKREFDNKYTNVLPSLNLRMKVSDELQFRGAYSKGMTRPDFYQLQTYTTLQENVQQHTLVTPNPDGTTTSTPVFEGVTFTGNGVGNPMLKPTRSDNFDVTAEYYFGKGNSLTLAVFNKRLKDIIIGRTSITTLNDVNGQPHDFQVTGPVNGATGRVSGFELGYQQYFDKLPGLLSGFGLSANYTYLDSRLNLNPPNVAWCTPSGTTIANQARDLAGCDTNGHVLGGLPLAGLSKNAYNLALLYDKDKVSARLAYSWRSKYLQAVNTYGTNGGDGIDANPDSSTFGKKGSVSYALPTWGGAYGQLDGSFQYKFSDNLTVSVEASNLTNAIYRQYMQQGIGMMERGAFYTGRSYSVRMGYSF